MEYRPTFPQCTCNPAAKAYTFQPRIARMWSAPDSSRRHRSSSSPANQGSPAMGAMNCTRATRAWRSRLPKATHVADERGKRKQGDLPTFGKYASRDGRLQWRAGNAVSPSKVERRYTASRQRSRRARRSTSGLMGPGLEVQEVRHPDRGANPRMAVIPIATAGACANWPPCLFNPRGCSRRIRLVEAGRVAASLAWARAGVFALRRGSVRNVICG
jgi:hypothetical protein